MFFEKIRALVDLLHQPVALSGQMRTQTRMKRKKPSSSHDKKRDQDRRKPDLLGRLGQTRSRFGVLENQSSVEVRGHTKS